VTVLSPSFLVCVWRFPGPWGCCSRQ